MVADRTRSPAPVGTWGRAMTEDPYVRVTVRFDEVPGTVLHFRALKSAAEAFRDAAQAQRLARVSIDNLVTASLAPLPCAQLWGE